MASKKLSALTAITSVGSDDLVYVADTADGGSTYASKKVTKANFLSEYITTTAATTLATNNETHIDNMATLTGVAKDATLGTFTGSTISDASDIKTALQDLETAAEAAQAGSAVPIGLRPKLTQPTLLVMSPLWVMIMLRLLLRLSSPMLASPITHQRTP